MIRKLCDIENLPEEGKLKAFIDLREETHLSLCVGVLHGHIYAIDNTCPHQRASLAAGILEGEFVACPVHGWKWNLITGQAFHPYDPQISCYEVRTYGDEAFVKISAPPGPAAPAPSPGCPSEHSSCRLPPFSAIR